MNLFEATLRITDDAAAVEFAGFRLSVPPEVLDARPGAARVRRSQDRRGCPSRRDGGCVARGRGPGAQRIPAVIELVEALGSDVVVHFTIHAAPALTDDVKELAIDIGDPIVDGDTAGSHTNVVARLNPRTSGSEGRAHRAGRRHTSAALLRPRGQLGDLRQDQLDQHIPREGHIYEVGTNSGCAGGDDAHRSSLWGRFRRKQQ